MNLEELVIPIKTTFDKGVLIGATAAITAFVGLATVAVKATFDWAESLDKLGDVTGMSNKKLAAWTFTAKKAGVPVETLTKGMVILEKGLVKADGTLDITGKKLKEFGISALEVNGKVKDQSVLMDDISKKYNSFSTQQERVNFLTDVFGKSGAELVDVFDTLAAEGGIDAVTKKVEAFGLVIDPARYEQFSRNLEEIKLMGTGLAIAFTEKVMPAFESLVQWFMKLHDMTPSEIFKELIKQAGNLWELMKDGLGKADKFVAGVIDNMTEAVNRWTNSDGPQKLIDGITEWVNGIGSGPGFDSTTLNAAVRLVKALADAFKTVDWSPLGTAISDKFNEEMKKLGIDPEIAKEVLATTGIIYLIVKLIPIIVSIGTIIAAVVGIIGIAVGWISTFISIIGLLMPFITGILEIVGSMAILVFAIVLKAITGVLAAIVGAIGLTAALWLVFAALLVGTILYVIAHWDQLSTTVKQLWFIMQYYTGRGVDWIIGKVNDLINWLKDAVDWLRTLGGLIGSTNVSTSSGVQNRRASGGPVIAGQSYNVAEFNRPEVFTPNQSGRIDQKANDTTIFAFDYNLLARVLAVELAKVTN